MQRLLKFAMVVIVLFSLQPYTASAAEIGDNFGEVIELEPDFTAVPDLPFRSEIESLSLTTFSTQDYRNGLFDQGIASLSSSQYPLLIDNRTNTGYEFQNFSGIRVLFNVPVDITGYYVRYSNTSQYNGTIDFGSARVRTDLPANSTTGVYQSTSMKNISSLQIYGNHYYSSGIQIQEIEIFGEPSKIYESVKNVELTVNKESASVSWENPNLDHFSSNAITLNGTNVHAASEITSYTFTSLTPETDYTFTIAAVYEDGQRVNYSATFKTLEDTDPPQAVSNLKASYHATDNAVTLSYELGARTDYVNIYRNNELIAENVTAASYTDSDIIKNRNYTYKIVSVNKHATAAAQVAVQTSTIPPKNVVNVKAEATADAVILTYEIGSDADSVAIYRNSQLLAENITANSYTDSDVQASTNYTYKIIAVSNANGKANGVIVTARLATKEIENLKAVAKDYRVDLSWKLPVYEDFHHVVVYRQQKQTVMARMMFRSADDFSPIFETNGTYLNDLTVEPDTKYTYKLTTVNTSDDETDGITLDVQTQKPIISGSSVVEDPTAPPTQENKPYVVSWGAPVKGEVKIMIGGTLYATVPASQKSITVPFANMQFTSTGQPDVKIVAVAPNGTESEPTSPLGTAMLDNVFTASNVLTAAVALLSVVGGLLLLRLSFVIVPKLISIITNSIGKKEAVTTTVEKGRRS